MAEQLASLPKSIVLRLDLCSGPILSHTTCPAMIGCGISWLDEKWTRKEYFVGLKLLQPPSFCDDTHILSSVTQLLTSLDIQMSDCCALTTARSPLLSRSHSFPFASDFDLEITCVGDLFSDLVTVVAKAFLNDEFTSGTRIAGPKISLIQTLQKANYLIHFLKSNHHDLILSDERLADLQLECIDWENFISISSSLSRSAPKEIPIPYLLSSPLLLSSLLLPYLLIPISCHITSCRLLQCNDVIRNLLNHFQDKEISASYLRLLPTEMDWELWGELVSIMEPLNSVLSLLRQGRGECHLSLLWYIVDWIVCIYDQTSDWEVFSVRHGRVISIPSHSLSQPIIAFQSSVIGLLRESYLTDSLMMTHPRQYEVICVSTLLDPRTKDFGFFRSSSVSYPPYIDYPALYFQDARSFILTELRTEMCSLLESCFEESDGGGFPPDSLSSATTTRAEAVGSTSSSFFDDSGGATAIRAILGKVVRDSGGKSSLRPTSLALRRCIEEHCRNELLRYENEPMICLPHQIRHYDPLTYWASQSEQYPILSRVARRFMSIRMIPSSLGLKGLTDRVFSKNCRKTMCPVLFEAVAFLHLNGILDYQFPDRS